MYAPRRILSVRIQVIQRILSDLSGNLQYSLYNLILVLVLMRVKCFIGWRYRLTD